jgi:large subunit ribosomal protein L34
MTKRTLQGTNRKRIKTSGFRMRMHTSNGRKIIQSRRRKHRKKVSICQ